MSNIWFILFCITTLAFAIWSYLEVQKVEIQKELFKKKMLEKLEKLTNENHARQESFEHLENHVKNITWQSLLKEKGIGVGGDIQTSGETYLEKIIKDKTSELIVIDGGSNEGKWSNYILNTFLKAKVYAFEPNETLQEINWENNKDFEERYILEQIGLSQSCGRKPLYQVDQLNGLSSLYPRKLDHFGLDMKKGDFIDLITLDAYCDDNEIDHIDILKLDIEGHELSALEGSKQILQKTKIIQFEFGGCNIDSRTFMQDFWYFLYKDFNLYRVTPKGLIHISKYTEDLEQFVTTNYTAIRK